MQAHTCTTAGTSKATYRTCTTPEQWYQYALQQDTATFRAWKDAMLHDDELVQSVRYQAWMHAADELDCAMNVLFAPAN